MNPFAKLWTSASSLWRGGSQQQYGRQTFADGKSAFVFDADGNPVSDMALPSIMSFGSLAMGAANTYLHRHQDEARRHSRENAIAMRRDLHLMRLLAERKRNVTTRKWQFEADNPKDLRQKTVADAMTKIVRHIPRVRRIQRWLLEALWYGHYGVQVQWKYRIVPIPTLQHSGPIVPGMKPTIDLKPTKVLTVVKSLPVNGDKIDYHHDGTPYVLVNPTFHAEGAEIQTTSEGMGLMLRGTWRNRFLIHSHDPDDADYFDGDMAGAIHGVGIRSRLYWFDFRRRDYIAWYTETIQRFGLGIIVIEYDVSNPKSFEQAKKAAKNYSKNTALLMPRSWDGRGGEGVHVVEIPTGGIEILLRLQEKIEEQEELYVIGQTMSKGGGDVSPGLGDSGRAMFARDTKSQIGIEDAEELAETLTGSDDEPGLANQIFKFTFPWADFPCPRWVYQSEDVDVEAKMAAMTQAAMFVPFKTDSLYDLTGEPRPEDGDETFGGPQLPAAPTPGGAPPKSEAEKPSPFDAIFSDYRSDQPQRYAADQSGALSHAGGGFYTTPLKLDRHAPYHPHFESAQPDHRFRQEAVPIESLRTSQDSVTQEGLDHYHAKDGPQPPVMVYRKDGLNFLVDGNHRAATAWLRRQKSIPAHVYDESQHGPWAPLESHGQIQYAASGQPRPEGRQPRPISAYRPPVHQPSPPPVRRIPAASHSQTPMPPREVARPQQPPQPPSHNATPASTRPQPDPAKQQSVQTSAADHIRRMAQPHIEDANRLASQPYNAQTPAQMVSWLNAMNSHPDVSTKHLHAIGEHFGVQTGHMADRGQILWRIGEAMRDRSLQAVPQSEQTPAVPTSVATSAAATGNSPGGIPYPEADIDVFSEVPAPQDSRQARRQSPIYAHATPEESLKRHWPEVTSMDEFRGLAGKPRDGDHFQFTPSKVRRAGEISLIRKNGTSFDASVNGSNMHVDGFFPGMGVKIGGEFGRADMKALYETALKLGIKTIDTTAAGLGGNRQRNIRGRSGGHEMIGFSLWPKMGFDAILPVDISRPPHLANAKTVQDLYATREGAQWWDRNGRTIQMKIDLTDTNSLGTKRLLEYVGIQSNPERAARKEARRRTREGG